MVNRMQFYIDGAWVDPDVKKSTPVVIPATEEAMYEVALGSKADVDKAVAAAKRAFLTYSQTSREERVHAGSAEELSFRGKPRHRHGAARAGRRHRHDHAVELAAEPDRLQGRARARRRLHHDPEAVRIHAVLGIDLCGNPA